MVTIGKEGASQKSDELVSLLMDTIDSPSNSQWPWCSQRRYVNLLWIFNFVNPYTKKKNIFNL